MGVLGLLLGAWIYTVDLAAGLATAVFSIVAIISCSISWWRAVVSELRVDEISIVAKHGDLHCVVSRKDVSFVKCYDQTDIEKLRIVLKDGREIRIPEPCFINVRPIAVFLRDNWKDVMVELNDSRF
jgi:hypothetical protein